MKKLYLLFLLGILLSCNHIPQKPFIITCKKVIIIDKFDIDKTTIYSYYFIDKSGKEYYFEDRKEYNIGDTIK